MSMKVKVKLHGTLRELFPEYRPTDGIEMEIPPETTVKDLLTLLVIPEEKGAVVIANGRVLDMDHKMEKGLSLDVFQRIQGG